MASAEQTEAARAAVIAAARGWFESRRARVDPFVARHFGLRGALRLHRRALGPDLARAPANLALAPLHAGTRLAAWGAGRLGRRRTAAWLRGRRLLLETDVGREVRRLVVADLLELPWRAEGRDSLAEAILAAPEIRALAPGAARRDLDGALADYAGTRAALAEMTSAAAAIGAGAAAFGQVTPGMISLGPALAGAMAQAAAVAAFPLGAAAGSVWYATFPAAAPAGLVAGATLGMAGLGAVAAAFAGVLADPLQARLGLHRRRLLRLVDTLERAFVEGEDAAFAAREHYVARVLELADAAAAATRALRA
jgi:hypothetical protein